MAKADGALQLEENESLAVTEQPPKRQRRATPQPQVPPPVAVTFLLDDIANKQCFRKVKIHAYMSVLLFMEGDQIYIGNYQETDEHIPSGATLAAYFKGSWQSRTTEASEQCAVFKLVDSKSLVLHEGSVVNVGESLAQKLAEDPTNGGNKVPHTRREADSQRSCRF